MAEMSILHAMLFVVYEICINATSAQNSLHGNAERV